MKYYSINQVAEICGMNRKTITSEIKKGHLVAKRRIGRYWVEETDLKNWDDRNNISTLKNAVVAPGQPDPNKLSSRQPDKIVPQAEVELNRANTVNEKPGKPVAVDYEEADDSEIIKNAELFVAHWNKFSPTKCYTKDGHLDGLIKDKIEQLMRESNNDLTRNLLSVRIFFYLHYRKLIRGSMALPLTDYIKRNYHLIYAYPELTPEQEEDLDRVMEAYEINCLRCKKPTYVPGPREKHECPKCGERKEIEIRLHAVKDDGMETCKALRLFDDKYHALLKRSQKQIQASEREGKKRWIKGMGLDRRYLKWEEDPNTLDWSIVGDIYDLKNEVYDPEYLKRELSDE
jgi:hypothetical protein